ncbi:Kinase, NEK [Giardia muris]|uniref:non-specific serine/threonine protein kinase n=1 Tax=Giardia muris TaxID=5742 RepID=A0A4Z1T0R5_GIAMU|nr:Kinase, NEK [Giardia muris]|eukprot:TNJ27493.1 Kinase, NEK [Giardia muris]
MESDYALVQTAGPSGLGRQSIVEDRTMHVECLLVDICAASDEAYASLLDDVRQLYRLTSPSLVTIAQVYEAGERHLHVITSLPENGALADLIATYAEQSVRIPENLIWETAAQILHGLDYLHDPIKEGIADDLPLLHGRLSPLNILITDNSKIQLAEYGFCLDDARIVQPIAPSWGYASPNVLLGHKQTPGDDIYALGLVLLEMAWRRAVFPAERQETRDFTPPELIEGYSSALAEFIGQLLGQAETQPLVEQALRHPQVTSAWNRVMSNRHLSLDVIVDDEPMEGEETQGSGHDPDPEPERNEVEVMLDLMGRDDLEGLLGLQQFNDECFSQMTRIVDYLKSDGVLDRLISIAFIPLDSQGTELEMHRKQREAVTVFSECGYGSVVLEALLQRPEAFEPVFQSLEAFVTEAEKSENYFLSVKRHSRVLEAVSKLFQAIILSPNRLDLFFNLFRDRRNYLDLWFRSIGVPDMNEALRKLFVDSECRRTVHYQLLERFSDDLGLISRLITCATDSATPYRDFDGSMHILAHILTANVPLLSGRVLEATGRLIQACAQDGTPRDRRYVILDLIVCIASFMVTETIASSYRSRDRISSALSENSAEELAAATPRNYGTYHEAFRWVLKGVDHAAVALRSEIHPADQVIWLDFVARLCCITSDSRARLYTVRNQKPPSDSSPASSFNVPLSYGLKALGYGMITSPTPPTTNPRASRRSAISIVDTYRLPGEIVIYISPFTVCERILQTDLLLSALRFSLRWPTCTIFHLRYFLVCRSLLEYGVTYPPMLTNFLRNSRVFGLLDRLTTTDQYCSTSVLAGAINFAKDLLHLASDPTPYVRSETPRPVTAPTSLESLRQTSLEHSSALCEIILTSKFVKRFVEQYLTPSTGSEGVM